MMIKSIDDVQQISIAMKNEARLGKFKPTDPRRKSLTIAKEKLKEFAEFRKKIKQIQTESVEVIKGEK